MRGPHKPDGIMHVIVTVVDDHDEAVEDDKGQIKTAKADEKAQFKKWYRRPMAPVYTGLYQQARAPQYVREQRVIAAKPASAATSVADSLPPSPCMPVAEADKPYAVDWWPVGPVAEAQETPNTVDDPWSHLR